MLSLQKLPLDWNTYLHYCYYWSKQFSGWLGFVSYNTLFNISINKHARQTCCAQITQSSTKNERAHELKIHWRHGIAGNDLWHVFTSENAPPINYKGIVGIKYSRHTMNAAKVVFLTIQNRLMLKGAKGTVYFFTEFLSWLHLWAQASALLVVPTRSVMDTGTCV